jgi:hypothetical protein
MNGIAYHTQHIQISLWPELLSQAFRQTVKITLIV